MFVGRIFKSLIDLSFSTSILSFVILEAFLKFMKKTTTRFESTARLTWKLWSEEVFLENNKNLRDRANVSVLQTCVCVVFLRKANCMHWLMNVFIKIPNMKFKVFINHKELTKPTQNSWLLKLVGLELLLRCFLFSSIAEVNWAPL